MEIEPILKIYHYCGNTKNTCARKATFHIPPKYIHDISKKLYFDIGTINMEIGFRNAEEKDCRHKRSFERMNMKSKKHLYYNNIQ